MHLLQHDDGTISEQKSSGAGFRLQQFLVLLKRYFLYCWRHKMRIIIPFLVVILTYLPFMLKAYKDPISSFGEETFGKSADTQKDVRSHAKF